MGENNKYLQFIKKPESIEAVQIRWKHWDQICEFCTVGSLEQCYPDEFTSNELAKKLVFYLPRKKGLQIGLETDWIIKNLQVEPERQFYILTDEEFKRSYEPKG